MSLASLSRFPCPSFNSVFASARWLSFIRPNPNPIFPQNCSLPTVSTSVSHLVDWRSPVSHHASVQSSATISELFKRNFSKTSITIRRPITMKNAIDSGRRSRFRVPNKVITQFRNNLELKQKLHLYYGMKRNYLNYVPVKARKWSNQVLIQLLEMRLDTILVRMGLALTIPEARQLISHKHILVNGLVLNMPRYRCKPGDIISVEDEQRSVPSTTL